MKTITLIILALSALYILYWLVQLILLQRAFNDYRHIERKVRGGKPKSAFDIWVSELVVLHLYPVERKSGNPRYMSSIDEFNTSLSSFKKSTLGLIIVTLISAIAVFFT